MVDGKAASESFNLLNSKPITVLTSDLATFLHSASSWLPSPSASRHPPFPFPHFFLSLSSHPFYRTASFLPSFIENAGRRNAGGRISVVCVCVGTQSFLTLSRLPWPGVFEHLLLMDSQEHKVTFGASGAVKWFHIKWLIWSLEIGWTIFIPLLPRAKSKWHKKIFG